MRPLDKKIHTEPLYVQRKRNVLYLNIFTDPLGVEPPKFSDPLSFNFGHALFEGLMRLTKEQKAVPALTEKVETSHDKKTYRFFLKKSFWSDGSRVTAHDFKNTWRHLLDPDQIPILGPPETSPNSYLLDCIFNGRKIREKVLPISELGVKAETDYILHVQLEQPIAYFFDLLAHPIFYPLHRNSLGINEDEDDDSEEFHHNAETPLPITNGPFKLKEWKEGEFLILEKNELYREASRVQLKEIHFTILSTEVGCLAAYLHHFVDIIGMPFFFFPSPLYSQALLDHKTLDLVPIAGTSTCVFNTKNSLFKNQKIRKAFSLAIDRERIIQKVTILNEQPAHHLLPPILVGAHPIAPSISPHSYRVKKARRLFLQGLKELGLDEKNLPAIPLSYPNSEFHFHLALEVKNQFESVLNHEIILDNCNLNILKSKMSKRNFHLGLLAFCCDYSHPSSFMNRFKDASNTKNYSGWSRADFVSLLEQADSIEDLSSRNALYHQAQKIMAEEAPLAPIFHWNFGMLVQPYVKGFYMSPNGILHFDEISIDHEIYRRMIKGEMLNNLSYAEML